MKKLLLSLIVLFPIFTFSQESKGTIQFYVYPDTLHILIDSSIRIKSNEKISLTAGKHNLLIKGKILSTINESFNIYKDSTVYFRKIVGYNDSYKKYKSEMAKYSFYSTSFVIASSALVLGGYYVSYAVTKQLSDQQKESKRLAEYYATQYQFTYNESELKEYQDKFRSYKKDYDRYRVQKFMMVPVALLTTFFAYKSVGLYKKIKKPTYLEPLSFNMGYIPGNYTNYSLTYKF